MTNKELRKLSRRDLLQLLVQREDQIEILQTRVTELEELFDNRNYEINKAGSLAEAALILSGVFEAADKACSEYKESLQRCSESQEKIYNQIVYTAEQKATEIIRDAEIEKRRKIAEADAYWKKLSNSLEEFYQKHKGLKELLAISKSER